VVDRHLRPARPHAARAARCLRSLPPALFHHQMQRAAMGTTSRARLSVVARATATKAKTVKTAPKVGQGARGIGPVQSDGRVQAANRIAGALSLTLVCTSHSRGRPPGSLPLPSPTPYLLAA
jgi:hypothetical protein